MADQLALVDVPPRAGIDDENQRFTTRATKAWCLQKAKLDEYTLDVAACEESHLAHLWYSQAMDGLSLPWFGDVWCNPPWDDLEAWVQRCWLQWRDEPALNSVSMLLPGNRTEQPWWQRWVEPYRDLGRLLVTPFTMPSVRLRSYFLPGRTPYGSPGNPTGRHVTSPPFTSVLLVWRRS